MAASRYKKFLHLCERWTVDKSRDNRDFGTFLRKKVLETFSKGEASVIINERECDKTFDSLQRMSNDFHKRKWQRSKETNASGFSIENLKYSLSTEGLANISEQNTKGLVALAKDKLFKAGPGQTDQK